MEGGVRWEGHFSGSKGLGGKEWMHLQSEQALRLIYVTDPEPRHKSSTTSPQTHTTLNLAKTLKNKNSVMSLWKFTDLQLKIWNVNVHVHKLKHTPSV